MSLFDEALGIDPDAKPAEDETKPNEEEPKKLKMHEHKEDFKEFAAEQKKLAGGS